MVATYLPKLFIAKELVDPHKNAGQQLRCLSHSWHPAALKIPGTSERGIGMAFLHAPVLWSKSYKFGEEMVSLPAFSKACHLKPNKQVCRHSASSVQHPLEDPSANSTTTALFPRMFLQVPACLVMDAAGADWNIRPRLTSLHPVHLMFKC